MIWYKGRIRSTRRWIFIATKNYKIHKAPPALDSTAGRTAEADGEEWDETQELLDDPVFMESHAWAENDKANGVARNSSARNSCMLQAPSKSPSKKPESVHKQYEQVE